MNAFEYFCKTLSQLLTNFFMKNIAWIEPIIEQDQYHYIQKVCLGIDYMIQLTDVKNDNIFKGCIEFWIFITDFFKQLGIKK